MSLQDVYRVEINLALVLVGQFVQGGNLPSKRRSGVAAEDENDGLIYPKRRQFYGHPGIECFDCEVGRFAAYIESALAGAGPHGLKGEEKVGRHGHFCHDMSEDFGWLAHGPVDVADEAEPKTEEHGEDASQPAFCILPDRHSYRLTWSGRHLLLAYEREMAFPIRVACSLT
jgi:hypothetical protein